MLLLKNGSKNSSFLFINLVVILISNLNNLHAFKSTRYRKRKKYLFCLHIILLTCTCQMVFHIRSEIMKESGFKSKNLGGKWITKDYIFVIAVFSWNSTICNNFWCASVCVCGFMFISFLLFLWGFWKVIYDVIGHFLNPWISITK